MHRPFICWNNNHIHFPLKLGPLEVTVREDKSIDFFPLIETGKKYLFIDQKSSLNSTTVVKETELDQQRLKKVGKNK